MLLHVNMFLRLIISLAAVQAVDPCNVARAHASSCAESHVTATSHQSGFAVLREGHFAVVHDRVIVIGSSQVHSVRLLEVMDSIFNDVLPQDSDVAVSVRSLVFMVEAQSVKQLVLDDSLVNTAVPPQGEILFASSPPNVRPAATVGEDVEIVSLVAARDEADAGCCMEGVEGLFDPVQLIGRVVPGDDVGYIDFLVP